jgi:DNA-directed RNA polymerase subunit K/omega
MWSIGGRADEGNANLSLSRQRIIMVKRPDGMNAFEFVVAAGLRAAQLQRGCTPRVEQSQKIAVTAQREVAKRKVLAVRSEAEQVSPSNDEQL